MDDKAGAEVGNIEVALVERLRADRVRVPPYPAVIAKLQAVLANDRASARDVTAVVATDTALSAILLRRASSAAQVGGAATTLEAAVTRLGSVELVELAIAATVGTAATAAGPLSALRRDIWRTSLMSARLCQVLGGRRKISSEVAFLAGLLHDFGSVVVVAALEDVANKRRLEVLPEHAWHDLVSKYHVEFGMVLAVRWNLNDAVAEVIARHHNPAANLGSDLVGLVATVDRVIDVLEHAPESGLGALRAIPGLDDSDCTEIGLAIGGVARQLESLEYAMPPAKATVATPSAVASKLAPDAGWPTDLAIAFKHDKQRVSAIWPDRFTCRGVAPLQPNWLADVVIETPSGPLAMLVNVRECERDAGRGDYASVVQPYALAGDQKTAWLQILDAARQAAPSDDVRIQIRKQG